LHEEALNPYYQLRSQVEIIDAIFEEFGLHPKTAKLVNGHVPKDITQGEDVILAKGKVYLIDGGMSKQYKNKTEIGGYTLISDSYAYYLVSHSRFESVSELIDTETDMISLTHEEDLLDRRSYIYDTDNGQTLKEKINDLNHLIEAYRNGTLKEASLKEK
jgi:fructose-1,6-bisphosphatase-3